MKLESTNQYRFETLFEAIKAQGPTFDNIEYTKTVTWDETQGAFRYCRSVRVYCESGFTLTLWIHTLKGDLSHVVYSVNGMDEYIDLTQFPWGYPDEYQVRKMISDFIAEVAG